MIVRPNRVNQRRTPDEDAKSLVFDDTLLFDIDKFSGYDRLETGTRANIGMQYTLQANNGLYARAVFGQSIHLCRRERVCRPGLSTEQLRSAVPEFLAVSGLQTDRSDYVAGLYVSPFAGINLVVASPVRRERLDAAPAGRLLAGQLRSGARAGGLYVYALRPVPGIFDTQQEMHHRAGLAAHGPLEHLGQLRYDIDCQNRIQD